MKLAQTLEDIDAMKMEGLSDDQEFLALIIWAMRNMIRSPRVKPLQDWTMADIISFSKGLSQ